MEVPSIRPVDGVSSWPCSPRYAAPFPRESSSANCAWSLLPRPQSIAVPQHCSSVPLAECDSRMRLFSTPFHVCDKVALPLESCNVPRKMVFKHMHLHGCIFEELLVKNLGKLRVRKGVGDLLVACSPIRDTGNSIECCPSSSRIRVKPTRICSICSSEHSGARSSFGIDIKTLRALPKIASAFRLQHEGSARVSFEGTAMIRRFRDSMLFESGFDALK